MKIRYLIVFLLAIMNYQYCFGRGSNGWLSIGGNYNNTSYFSKSIIAEAAIEGEMGGSFYSSIGFNYTGAHLKLNINDNNFLFQHRFSLFFTIGERFTVIKNLDVIPTIGFGISKYLHFGNIPDYEITNMSYIYPTIPITVKISYKDFSVAYRADYYGNMFRKNQYFSGMRHFLMISFVIKEGR